MKISFLKILLLSFLLLPIGAFAQTAPKFGHLNLQELMAKMPKVLEAQKKLEQIRGPYEIQMTELETEYQKKIKEYQEKMGTWPEAIRKSKESEIMLLQQRIGEFEQTASEELNKKREELMTPILTEVQEAIKAIAKEKGYSYIFDTSLGSVLYAVETEDITPILKQKLSLK